MTQDKPKTPVNKGQKDPKVECQERLNQALRDNLKKRKSQFRARTDGSAKSDSSE